MVEWAKTVTHPLGLAGFALFIVFLYLSKKHQPGQPEWLRISFIIMACIALLGGLWLASTSNPHSPPLAQLPRQAQPSSELKNKSQHPTQEQLQSNSANQQTIGKGSPAIVNTGRDVDITITNSKPFPPETLTPKNSMPPSAQAKSPQSTINQHTSGDGSPAIANTGRDVTITVTNP